ncbi:peptidase M50B-like-domain-containing protein [Gorgonomyces haynaldii]|nr:peptidase M50B-like-domain-containing protein [Gorgonomyces haynaldii]
MVNATDIQKQLDPSASQWQTIYVLIGYTVFILVFWNLPYLKEVLWPFKILTVGLHEFGHASAGWMTGAHVESITLNPDEGGLTRMRGGNPYISLPAGYIGSTVWGSLMVFAGFNTTASKVVAVIVGLCMLLVLWWAKNWLTRGVTVLFIGLIALLWWLEGGFYLRYFVLFVGIMSSLYSLWDIIEDLVVRKVNESDASQFSRLCCGGCLPPQAWGVIWFLFSLLFLAVAITGALAAFKET